MRKLLFLIALFLYACASYGQELGKPFLHNYLPKEYNAHTQNWSVVQDDRGLMYFANTQGVLEYDGASWRKIKVGDETVSRCVVKSSDGTIYIGSQASFGYLKPNALGQLEYQSLVNNLPEEHRKFSDVWAVQSTEDGVYFMTDYKIFRFSHSKVFERLWVPKGNQFFLSYAVEEDVFVFETKVGLQQLIKDEFQLIEGSKQLIGQNVFSIIPYIDQKLLLVTRKNGLYIYDKKRTGANAIYPYKNALSSKLGEFGTYCALKVNDNSYAFGTSGNGMYIMDSKGREVININQQVGLQNNQVWNLGLDKQGGIWVCMNKGISRIELKTPITYWGEKEGVGKVMSIAEFNGQIYLATGRGVYYHDKVSNTFELVEGLNNQSWRFLQFKDSNQRIHLLANLGSGIYEITGNTSKKIHETSASYVFCQISKFPNHVFYGMSGGIGVLNYNPSTNKWTLLGKIEDDNLEEIRSFAEDHQQHIFAGSKFRGVCKLVFANDEPLSPNITVYDTLNGLPSMSGNEPLILKNELVFTTIKGLYKLDHKQEKFIPSDKIGASKSGDRVEKLGVLGVDKEDKVWFRAKNLLGNISLKTKLSDTTLFKRLPTMEVNAFYEEPDKNIIWLGGSEGLFRYDKNLREIIPSYNALLRGVTLGEDSIVYGGAFIKKEANTNRILLKQDPAAIPSFSYASAFSSMMFKFSAPSYDQEAANRYKYRLEKASRFSESHDKWSHWTEKSEKEYTNLSEGTYTFRVRAKNIYDIESQEMLYRFTVLPPWYRTIMAYIAYVIGAALLIWLIVRLNTARLQKANERLERLIDERTTEIKSQNVVLRDQKEEILNQNTELKQQQEEILMQRDHIEGQNKSLKEKNDRIVDSIRYAQTIQEGILPFSERLNRQLKEYFVLYRPKDIVSGDFYWFENCHGRNYFAVADCTGHGVPGAFMSMIGTATLNDIVLKGQAITPAEVLEEMNRIIIKVLKQEHVSGNQDGMDICLVSWEEVGAEIHLQFTGAHRPLYVRSGQEQALIELKSTNKSIGGHQMADRRFLNAEMTLQKGDAIFLTTDGYVDQNNQDNKKIGSIQLKELLQEHGTKSMSEVDKLLNQYLDNHQEEVEQRDDITIIGIRF